MYVITHGTGKGDRVMGKLPWKTGEGLTEEGVTRAGG